MSIYIDDPEAEALVMKLARIRGVSLEEAVRISVVHALQELDALEVSASATRVPNASRESQANSGR